jgi:phenylalanyl-tRNA synthetase alpha chain
MFHQVEGLLVDRQVSFADLKGVLTAFMSIRCSTTRPRCGFGPVFSPLPNPVPKLTFVVSSAGVKGCRVCSHTGWLEVLGSGMVHPAVFENVGYDTRQYTGFAFGMGVERIAMLKFGIDDIRRYFDNDYRFLSQF